MQQENPFIENLIISTFLNFAPCLFIILTIATNPKYRFLPP